MPGNHATVRCRCGNVELEAVGDPIVSAVCYCESCQEGSRQIEALPNGRPVCDSDGGTPAVLYRKDRVEYSKGSGLCGATSSLTSRRRAGSSPRVAIRACTSISRRDTGCRYTTQSCGETYRPWRCVYKRSPGPQASTSQTTYQTIRAGPSSSWRSSLPPGSR